MKIKTLKNRLLFSFLTVNLVLAVSVFCLGYWVIQQQLFERTQKQVNHYLDSARLFYASEIENIGTRMKLVSYNQDLETLRKSLDLDYLFRLSSDNARIAASRIVQKVFESRVPMGGTRLVGPEELARMPEAVRQRARIPIKGSSKEEFTEGGIVKEYALPLLGPDGQIESVIYGGRLVNQDYIFVDKLRLLVFGEEQYRGKPVGTVTIFQDGIRIATNVLDKEGRRAVGTHVSQAVYDSVIREGRRWHDRAEVVGNWYRSAYEPIRDIDGNIIGILYVGILEEQLTDIAAKILVLFLLAVAAALLLAGIVAFVLTGSILHPITLLLEATRKLAKGEWGHEVPAQTSVEELDQLAKSFNEMSAQLRHRELSLKISNEKLAELNKSYLDLIGFVAHELKGMLASAVINAYSLRDGLLGMLNFKQKRAIDSICRNLDYLDATVKKFLNLSRIEREKLEINKQPICLRKDIVDISVHIFSKLIEDKQMTVVNRIDPALRVNADPDLLQIVANNLINNAAKYGAEGGRIELSARLLDGRVEVEVYNDGRPIQPNELPLLFKKFSRLDNPDKKKVKGTGLGLYITKQIIEAHGGQIRVEPRAAGNAFIFQIERE
ncbi:MAG TPA: cache domain-containing protein [Anaerohalosphaeraceae bacterium]|nr:cache domain-containing protein [Anaerohalosphaeraceae bacterium]